MTGPFGKVKRKFVFYRVKSYILQLESDYTSNLRIREQHILERGIKTSKFRRNIKIFFDRLSVTKINKEISRAEKTTTKS